MKDNNDQRQAKIIADMLAVPPLLLAYQSGLLLSFAVLLRDFAARPFSRLTAFVIVIGLMLVLSVVYYSMRVAFDRRVFRAMAHGEYTAEDFDQALLRWRLKKSTVARDMLDRGQGALRLYRRLLTATLLLTAAELILFIRLAV